MSDETATGESEVQTEFAAEQAPGAEILAFPVQPNRIGSRLKSLGRSFLGRVPTSPVVRSDARRDHPSAPSADPVVLRLVRDDAAET